MKREATKYAGIELTKLKKYHPEVEDMLLGNNPLINEMIIEYVWMQQSTEFTLLAGFEQRLYVLTLEMLGGETNVKVSDIRDLQREINDIKDQLLAFDRSNELRKELYKKTDEIRLELRPEDIAQKLADGVDPVDVKPYGDKYRFNRYGKRGSLPEIQ
jgi:hypothetical protein